MTHAIHAAVYFAEAVIVAAAVLTAAAIVIGRIDRGDDRAASEQACTELDERLQDEPVPYWPADDPEPDEKTVSKVAGIVFCPLCHPGGHGKCTCVAYCGDRQCTYDHTGRFTAEEAAWLWGLGITDEPGDDWRREYDQEGNEL